MKFFPILGIGCLVFAQSSTAALVWSDDFSRGATTTAVNPYNYAGLPLPASQNDYTATTSTLLNAAGYANINDTGTGAGTLRVESNRFVSLPTGAGDQVTISYDFRVNRLDTVTSAASVPRFSIMNGSISGNNEAFGVGFGWSTFTGAPASTLGFFWGQSGSAAINTTRGIGINSTGFAFGTYDSTTAANNDTNGDWYRISFTMTEAATGVSGSITRLSAGLPTSDTASFTGALTAALDWDSGLEDGIKITSGATGLGNFDFDNITINVVPVPEPSVVGLMALGAVCGLRRRR